MMVFPNVGLQTVMFIGEEKMLIPPGSMMQMMIATSMEYCGTWIGVCSWKKPFCRFLPLHPIIGRLTLRIIRPDQ